MVLEVLPTLALAVTLHPLLSVTVTLYVLDTSPPIEAVVPPVDQAYLNGDVLPELVTATVAEPLCDPQVSAKVLTVTVTGR